MEITFTNFVSLVCLFVTGICAAWGVFSRHFDDSLTQRVGLSGVALACLLRVPQKFGDVPEPPAEILLAQISLAIYSAGTWVKFWRAIHRQPERRMGRRFLGKAFPW